MHRRAAAIAVVLSLALSNRLSCQDRTPTDRSLAQSLLAISFPAPSAPVWGEPDSVRSAQKTRVALSYGRAIRAGIGGLRPTIVVALRDEELTRQATGPTAGVFGVRLGLRADDKAPSIPITSAEVYIGGRTMNHASSAVGVEGGFDMVFGWGGFDEDTRASIGMRAPVELVAQNARTRFTIFAAPAMAWGHIRMRGCDDLGPDDNCGDLGIQLAFGRTRFVAGGGASLTMLPARISLAAGLQKLFATGETERAWVGMSWTP